MKESDLETLLAGTTVGDLEHKADVTSRFANPRSEPVDVIRRTMIDRWSGERVLPRRPETFPIEIRDYITELETLAATLQAEVDHAAVQIRRLEAENTDLKEGDSDLRGRVQDAIKETYG